MPTGELIKKIRKEKNMTQRQLGEKCGIADSNIRKYENGKQFPKWETLERIAQALGVDIFDLIEIEPEPTESERNIIDLMSGGSGILKNIAIDEDILIEKYRSLNEKGQDKALEQVEMLTKIPEYRKED